MKCAEWTQLLPLLQSGDLSPQRRAAVEQHLSACEDCRRHLLQLDQTVRLLREAGRRQTVPADFSTKLHARLSLEPPPPIPVFTKLWWKLEALGLDSGPRLWACAMAAAMLVVLSTLTLRDRGPGRATVFVPEETVAASFRIPSHRVAVVQLDFVADASVDDVEFEITLPGELEFVDAGQAIAERHLAWRGSLAVGSNPVPVAVRGARPGRYRVTAQAKGRDVTVRHEVMLEVVPS